MKEKQIQTQKSTRTATMTASAAHAETTPFEFLEPMEEKFIRMRYGLSEDESKQLEYAVGASEDTRMRVTMMEANNISELDAEVPVAKNADRSELRALIRDLDV